MDKFTLLLEDAKYIVPLYGFKIISAIFLLVVGLWLIRRLDRILRLHFHQHFLDSSLKIFLITSLNIFLKLVLVMAIAGTLGIKTTFFMTVIGSIGLALGLALQGSLTNVAGGFLILFFRPFRVGDAIEAQGFQGTVTEINVLWTVITTAENKSVNLPNGPLANGAIVNASREENRRVEFLMGIRNDNNFQRTKNLFMQTIVTDERVLKKPAPAVTLKEVAPDFIKILVQVWCARENMGAVQADLQEKIKNELDRVALTESDSHIQSSVMAQVAQNAHAIPYTPELRV